MSQDTVVDCGENPPEGTANTTTIRLLNKLPSDSTVARELESSGGMW